jgi:hypothetical protein
MAKNTLDFAIVNARKLNQYISPEHMLLGFLDWDYCIAAQILTFLGFDKEQLLKSIEHV